MAIKKVPIKKIRLAHKILNAAKKADISEKKVNIKKLNVKIKDTQKASKIPDLEKQLQEVIDDQAKFNQDCAEKNKKFDEQRTVLMNKIAERKTIEQGKVQKIQATIEEIKATLPPENVAPATEAAPSVPVDAAQTAIV